MAAAAAMLLTRGHAEGPIRLTNERGENADIGQSGGGNNAFDAFIDKAFIDGSKEVTVTVSNPYTEWNFDWKSDAAVPAGE